MVQRTEEEKKELFSKLSKWLKALLPDDFDKFDLRAEMDPAISYEENKEIIRDKLGPFIKTLQEKIEEDQAMEEMQQHAKKREAEKEVLEYNKQGHLRVDKDIAHYYERVHLGVQRMAAGYSDLMFVKGAGGLGKSRAIRQALQESKAEFMEITGEVTDAYLYRLIYENNGTILWLKDTVGLLKNPKSMNLIKSACETEDNKVLTKSSYSKAQEDLPDQFLCKCKFIFDYNHIGNKSLKTDFEALVSRGEYIPLSFSEEDIKNIMRHIAKTDWEKEVTEFIVNNFESKGLVKLNLRTQKKAFNTYKFCKKTNKDWKEVLKVDLAQMSKERSMIYTLIGDKAIRSKDLKMKLLQEGIVSSVRSAHRKVSEWIYLEELYKVSEDERNFYVCIIPNPKSLKNK